MAYWRQREGQNATAKPRRGKMLFMAIYTWEPEKGPEVQKRRLEQGRMTPEGMKVIGEWSAIGGGRTFLLVDVADPTLALAASGAWSDLGKVEPIPVIETEEALKLIAGG
jgi:hypothetical protein